MPERILFLTGRLAEKSLQRVLASMTGPPFSYQVREIGIQVAGLMTAELVRRRVAAPVEADRILVPGRCRGDLDALSAHYGIPVERGPEELKDIPEFFGHGGRPPDLSRYAVRIFAEIVDAPRMPVSAILERAERYRRDGADVIDLGCLPDTPFAHLEEAVEALKGAGFAVSVDSLESDELLRGGRAGADYLLSLKEDTLWIADEVASTPVLIPSAPTDMGSLYRAVDALQAKGRAFFADPILEPIHFGFTESIARYRALRQARPSAPVMMGIGNVTELTDADTSGIHAVLLGVISELGIEALLTTEVSPHCRGAVREADAARRMMFAAREESSLPKDFSDLLLQVHGRKPFPDTSSEIAEVAAGVRDPSFRIQVAEDGIHIYNRDGHHVGGDPFQLYSRLGVEQDGGHAFYLGVELARAQIAWELGKRYNQDEALDWGCAVGRAEEDKLVHHAPGATLRRQAGQGKE